MGIRTEKQVVIECDCCGSTFIEAFPRAETIKFARKAGWSIYSDGSVKCYRCKETLK